MTTGLGLLAGLFGGIGVGAVIPLFSFLSKSKGGDASSADFVSDKVEVVFNFFHIEYNLFFLITAMMGLFVLKALVTYMSYYVNEKVATDYEKETRQKLFEQALMASWPFLLKQKIGHL